MALNGIDPAARTPARTRRNWGRTTKGAMTATLATTQPVIVSGSGKLTLNVAAAGGIDTAVGALKLKLNAAGALSVGALGVAVAVDGTTIEIGSNALRIKDGGVGAAKLGVLTTKGDVLGFSTVHVRVSVGSDGQVLTADSASAAGIKWVTPTGVVAGADTNVQFNDSGAFGGNNKLTFNKTTGDLSATGAYNTAATISTVNGSVSGNIQCAQPFQGASYKKVVIYCNGLNGTAVYTFPVAFTYVPNALGTNAAAATSLSAGSVTVSGPASGYLFLEGY